MGGGGGSGSGGIFGSGKQQSSSQFKMSHAAKYGETDALNRQNAIASGQVPSYANHAMQMYNDDAARQAIALAASQRGASNPALAFRQAQISNQQTGMQNAQAAALMNEQQKQQADQMILAQAAAQRGVALNSAVANQNAQNQANARNLQFGQNLVSGIGQGMVMGAAHGAVVPGKEEVPGDSVVNDKVPYLLSPGEVVVPKSAARDEKTLIAFVKSLNLKKEK